MLFRRLLCVFSIHLHAVWGDKGITCDDCGFFKSKYEHQADLHVGGGW